MVSIDLATDEYDQASAHFEGTRSGAIFGRASKRGRTASSKREPSEFMTHLRNGFAFTLPLAILILAGMALLVRLMK